MSRVPYARVPALLLGLSLAACQGGANIGPSPVVPTSPASGATPTASPVATLQPGTTPTPTSAGTATPTPGAGNSTPTATPSPAVTLKPGATPTPTATPVPTPTPTATVASSAGKVGHVWFIVEENESASATFEAGSSSLAPYLASTLKNQGAYLKNYYATGHVSLDNYIAMISGQPPSAQTTSDCTMGFNEFTLVTTDMATGVATGDGCVYPSSIKTLGDQLDDAGVTWKSYDEDMGNEPARDSTTATPFACGHPTVGTSDGTQSADAKDAYATRHNPFMYFHSIITDKAAECAQRVVSLQTAFQGDLANPPQFSFITPNLCHDGHDATCTIAGEKGGLPGVDELLKTLVPAIQSSAAYKKDGLIIVTFDEGGASDTTSCCNEHGQNPLAPAAYGGGVVGAVLLSPFVKGPLVDVAPYNHYSLLRYLETTFGTKNTINGTPFLGYASQATTFSASDFNNPSGT